MILVSVGKYTLNVEKVAAFVEEGARVKVIFDFQAAPGNGEGAGEGLYMLEIEGDAAEQLRGWIEKNAEAVRHTSPGFSFRTG